MTTGLDRLHQLRSDLLQILGDLIGTYTKGSQATPAIEIDLGTRGEVLATGVQFPVRPKVTGLEVIVQPDTELTHEYLIGSRRKDIQTLLTLKQWDITKTTIEATDAIVDNLRTPGFRIERVRPPVLRSTDLDTVESRAIVLLSTFLRF